MRARITEGRHLGQCQAISVPDRRDALGAENTVTKIDDCRDTQILARIDIAKVCIGLLPSDYPFIRTLESVSLSLIQLSEPRRVCQRRFGLSYAAMAWASSMAW